MTIKQKADKSFLKISPNDKTTFGQHVFERISTHEGQYPNLPYQVDVLKKVNDILVNANSAARSGSHSDIAARNNAEKTWDNIFSKTADYISFMANGNAEVITNAGFTPTAAETTPKPTPSAAVLDKMTQHEGGVAEVTVVHPGGGAVSAHLFMAVPQDAQVTTAGDGTITIALASGQKIYLKNDTHNKTTLGGMEAGKMMKMLVQPVNNKGTGGTSAPKSFTPQP